MRRKRLVWGSVIVAVLLILGIATYKVFSIAKALTGVGGLKGLGIAMRARTDPKKFFPGKDHVTVLVLGKDYNRDRKGMPYTKGSRSDTMMVLSVDLNSAKITAVSIPRDSKVTAADGVTDKINSVIVRGGPALVEDTLNELFGVRPDYYVILKPDAVRSIVDALGGVDVEAVDDMNYDDSWGQLHIHLTKGRHHILGPDAEGFVRFRKTTPGQRTHKGMNLEEGDLRRAARQQQLIHAMIEAAKSPGNLVRIDSIINTGFQQIETDLSRGQLLALGSFFQQAGTGHIEGGTLPGEDSTEGGVYYWKLDMPRSLKMMQWLINGDQVAGMSLPRIAVYNSSSYSAASRALALSLYSEGYDAFSAGGKPPLQQTSSVTFRQELYEPQAQALAHELGTPPPTKDASSPLDTWSPEVHVIVGNDLAKRFETMPAASAPTASKPPRKSRKHSRSAGADTGSAPDVQVDSHAVGH